MHICTGLFLPLIWTQTTAWPYLLPVEMLLHQMVLCSSLSAISAWWPVCTIMFKWKNSIIVKCFWYVQTQAHLLTNILKNKHSKWETYWTTWYVYDKQCNLLMWCLTWDRITRLLSFFMASNRSSHVQVTLWYSRVGITKLKSRMSSRFFSLFPL